MSEEKLVPEIRFKGFSGDWEQKLFGNAFDFPVSNNTVSRKGLSYGQGEVSNIHYGDILVKFPDVLDVKKTKLPFIIGVSREKYLSNLLDEGDVIIADAAEDRTVGKALEITGVGNESVVAGLHTIAARPRKTFGRAFLGNYLNSSAFRNQLIPLMQGVKVLSLSKKNVAKSLVRFPSEVEEQTRIGELFQNLDNLIVTNELKGERLKSLKQALVQKLFPQDKVIVPGIRFAGFTSEWIKKGLGDIVQWSKGRGLPKQELNQEGIGTPSVHYADLFKYSPIQHSVYNWSSSGGGVVIPPNSLLFAASSNTPDGPARTTTITTEGALAGGDVIIGTLDEGIHSEFLSYQVNAQSKKMESLVTGTTVSHINSKALSRLNEKLPTEEEQKEIFELLSNVDNLLTVVERKEGHLNMLKNALLQTMFV